MALAQGDVLLTGDTGAAEITLDDESVIRLEENSRLSLDSLNITPQSRRQVSFGLVLGRFFASIKKTLQGGHDLTVRTPGAFAAVKGTEFAVEVSEDESTVGVYDGQVEVSGIDADVPGAKSLLRPDQETSIGKGGRPGAPRKLSRRWQMQRENMDSVSKRAAAYRLLKKSGGAKKIRDLRKLLHRKVRNRLSSPERQRLQQFQKKNPQVFKKFQDMNKQKFRKKPFRP
jgi:hypothetical protein